MNSMTLKTSQYKHLFDEKEIIHELKHYLPTQLPLKDFIHHNSLHAFQDYKFYDAIFKASEIFGYEVTLPLEDFRELYRTGRITEDILLQVIKDRKGEAELDLWKKNVLTKEYTSVNYPRIGRLRANWKRIYHLDLDNLVQPILFRILSSYLDQGVAIWHFPYEDQGLLFAIRTFERDSFTSFFKGKRAKKLLFEDDLSIKNLLTILVGKEAFFEQYIFDLQFSHRGWSGMVGTLEDHPKSILYPKKITLQETIIFELLLEIDALDSQLGRKWKPLCEDIETEPLDLFADVQTNELKEVLMIWQDAFEWNYYDEVLSGVKHLVENKVEEERTITTSFQAVFCIDEREDSLRRHVEMYDPHCETLGCPGFFGVEFYFQPQNGLFYEKLCPAPVTPQYLIKEFDVKGHREHSIFYTKKSHTLLQGFLISLSLGVVAAGQLFLNLFRPKMNPAISDAFAHMNLHGQLSIESKGEMENNLHVGFTIQEMATRVENLLRGIGMVKDFAPLFYVVAHGSSSANNPHHGAHDCGACSGRPGSVNSRVFSFMANHPKVREILTSNGLIIPESTQFLGGLHDTASDEMAFYDLKTLSPENAKFHLENKKTFEKALDLNAKERSRRFASIKTTQNIKKVRKAIRQRSVSLFEPRPELGHGTNALCFVGRRSLTKGLFFDRRAFMNSYDYRTDPSGKLLLGVMRPLPPVCGGINLEYYFSRVDNYKLGAGTKLPHNVVGLIGVANSSDGDLRPGLPLQMIEVHDPVRLLIVVEHFPEVVLNTIKTEDSLYDWFKNEWVQLVAINPDTNESYFFKNGEFTKYKPIGKVKTANSIHEVIERAKGMVTNHIVDATKENLPIQIIK